MHLAHPEIMKAERRHELQTNSLALWLRWRLPQIWQQHGTKILLGLILVALMILVIRWRLNAPKLAYTRAEQALSQADQIMIRIRSGDTAHETDALKLVKSGQLPALVKNALDESDKPLIQARSYNLLGDYYYSLAIRRISPDDATTRPFQTDVSDKVLQQAKENYDKALEVKTDQPDLSARAHIGLGVIAISRAFQLSVEKQKWDNEQWRIAREQFEAVANDTKAPMVFQEYAKGYLRAIKEAQNPVLVKSDGTPPRIPPTSQPTAVTPTPLPTTRESLLPIAPTTMPAAILPLTRPVH